MLNRRQMLKSAAAAAPAVMLTGAAAKAQGPATSGSSSASAFSDFPSTFKGPVLRPGDSGYDVVKQLWNARYGDWMPALIARATDADDVQIAVKYAIRKNVGIAVRGGGHGIEGLAMPHEALVVDMSLMKGVAVDAATGRLTVQAGAKLGEMTAVTERQGWVLPAGTVSSVGVGGLALGGGMGHLTRRFGVTVDHLLSVDVVTMDGRKLIASATKNPELFWGMKGAGQNLAIATSFTFQGRRLESVRSQDLIYPPSRSLHVLASLHEVMARSPRTLSVTPVVNRARENEGWPAGWVGQAYVLASVVYTGPADGFDSAMSEMRRICGPALFTTEGPSTYTGVTSAIDSWFPSGRRWYNAGGYVDVLSEQVARAALEKVAIAPEGCELHFPVLGGAIFDAAEDSAAFSRANANWAYEITAMWDPTTPDAEFTGWVDAAYGALLPYTLSNGYINLNRYEGPASLPPIYGSPAKWERIVSLKRAWDPHNRLRYNKNILP